MGGDGQGEKEKKNQFPDMVLRFHWCAFGPVSFIAFESSSQRLNQTAFFHFRPKIVRNAFGKLGNKINGDFKLFWRPELFAEDCDMRPLKLHIIKRCVQQ